MTTEHNMTEQEQQAAKAAAERNAEEQLAVSDLLPQPQSVVLRTCAMALRERGQPSGKVTVIELHERTRQALADVRHNCDTLCQRGWLTVARESDARAYRITPVGREALQAGA